MVDIAIVGYNNIAKNIVKIIKEKNKNDINLKYIFGSKKLNSTRAYPIFINNFETILKDKNIKIVVETIDDVTKAYAYTKMLLESGKHVVTSNKKLVSEKGKDLTKIAYVNNVNYFFEASVDGSIPIIRPLQNCSKGNDILEINAILNTTSNFILTKLFNENLNLEQALNLAKQKRFTEENPEDDLNGTDASRKLSILTALAFGKHILPEDIHTRGIENISSCDIAYAKSFNAVIKLIGRVTMMENERIQISTEPMFVPNTNKLAKINGSFSAVLLHGDVIGEVMFYGEGAGFLMLADAIVDDIILCCENLDRTKYPPWQEANHGYIMPYSSTITSFYVRIFINDVFNKKFIVDLINSKFEKAEFLNIPNQQQNELAFITNVSTIKSLKGKLNELYEYGVQIKTIMRII